MGVCRRASRYAVMDKADAITVPQGLWEEAAATPLTFLVVYDMLVQRANWREWLLVTGVSAGVGVAALLAGKALGAKVIGTSGSSEKLERAEAARPGRRAADARVLGGKCSRRPAARGSTSW